MNPIHLPNQQTKKLKGAIGGYFTGDATKSFNVDTDTNPGRILLSRRAAQVINQTTLTTLRLPVAFIRTNADATDRFWSAGDNDTLSKSSGSDPYTGWAADSLANSPTTTRDLAVHEVNVSNGYERLVASITDDLSILNERISQTTVDALVIGGGAAGGAGTAAQFGGGGGAGGYVYETNHIVTSQAYSITIGSGGIGTSGTGGDGGNSIFDTILALGGGGGGHGFGGANSGGSGGGSGSGIGVVSGFSRNGQGNNGGKAVADTAKAAGGGGGALTAGGDGVDVTGGAGGNGIFNNIDGLNHFFSTGGGGAGPTTAGAGGNSSVNGGTGSVSGAATVGTANRGAGGGGTGGATNGADGGSGVIIIRYLTGMGITATGGSITTVGNYTVHTFTTSGTFTVTITPPTPAWIPSWWKSRPIVSSTNASPINVTVTNHGFLTGDIINVANHTGNTAANGTWFITKVDANNFTLNGSTGNGVGGPSGTAGYLNQPAMTAGIEHPMDVFNSTLMVGDGNFVHTIDANDVVQYKRLVIPSYLRIIHIFHSEDRVWICTRHLHGGQASVIEWDGTSDNYLEDHPVQANAALSGVSYENVPFIVNSEGIFMHRIRSRASFNGFAQFKGLEFGLREQNLTFPTTAIRPRGMVIKDGLIHINVGIAVDSFGTKTPYRLPSGVWSVDPQDGSFTHKWAYGQYAGSTNIDFGAALINAAGALWPLTENQQDLLIGAKIYTDASTTSAIIAKMLPDQSIINRGYLETIKISSAQVAEKFHKIWAKWKRFVDTTNNLIVIKSRNDDPYQNSTGDPLAPVTITWTGAATFTAVVPAGVVIGDEVEILGGDNAGCLFHILAFSVPPDGVATITVTLTENAPITSAKTAFAKFDNWKYIGTLPSGTSTTKQYDYLAAQQDGNFAQFKVELRGKFMQLEEVIISTTNQQNITS